MYQIPEGYPNDLTNQEIIEVIIELQSVQANRFNKQKTFNQSAWDNLLRLGFDELSVRLQSDLVTEITDLRLQIEELKINNKKASKWSTGLAFGTIFLAISTAIIGYKTLSYSEVDQISDEEWKNEQLNALIENNIQLKEMNKKLDEIPFFVLPDSLNKNP